MGRKSVEYLEFLILLSDVQIAINSRPLTEDAGLDINALNAFLCPHFNTALFLRDPEKIHELAPSRRSELQTF